MPSPAIEKVTMGTADPYPVGTPIDQAVAFLGEALRHERQRTANAEERAERLAAELDAVRKQMAAQAETFAKAIEIK